MAITVRDLITSALITSGAIAVGESPNGAEIKRGLFKFNDKVAMLSLENLWSYTIELVNGVLEKGKDVYTVGDTIGDEDFLTPRPPEIASLSMKYANVWYQLRYVSPIDFQNMTKLDQTSDSLVPSVYTYRPDSPVGTLQFYPTPAGAYDVQISTRYMKTEYTLNDEVDLPAGYAGYLDYAMAAILGVDYGVDVTEIAGIAQARKSTLKAQNYKPRTLKMPYITGGKDNYNIITDQFGGR